MSEGQWVVYLIRCADNSLYCGITNDLKKRIKDHNAGKGAKYTRSRLPVELVASATEMTKSDALKLEYRIKQVSADKKISELKQRKAISTLNLKKELQKVSDKINQLTKIVDKMKDAVESTETATKKKPAKEKVAKRTLKKAPAKKPTRGEAVQTILEIIKKSKNGIDTAGLMEKTRFNQKKIQNLLFKLRKQGKVKSISRGVYVIV